MVGFAFQAGRCGKIWDIGNNGYNRMEPKNGWGYFNPSPNPSNIKNNLYSEVELDICRRRVDRYRVKKDKPQPCDWSLGLFTHIMMHIRKRGGVPIAWLCLSSWFFKIIILQTSMTTCIQSFVCFFLCLPFMFQTQDIIVCIHQDHEIWYGLAYPIKKVKEQLKYIIFFCFHLLFTF